MRPGTHIRAGLDGLCWWVGCECEERGIRVSLHFGRRNMTVRADWEVTETAGSCRRAKMEGESARAEPQ